MEFCIENTGPAKLAGTNCLKVLDFSITVPNWSLYKTSLMFCNETLKAKATILL